MKKVFRKTFQEAISQELSKNVVSESVLDIPSNIAAGVKNVASLGMGSYQAGKIGNQLKRSADRIGKEWGKTSASLKKPIEKMSNSSNADIKKKAIDAINKVQSVEKDVGSAIKKMSSIAASGLASGGPEERDRNGALLNPFDRPEDFEDREITSAYGNKYTETPIQRWVKQMGMGADTKHIGVHEWSKINKAWLEMRSAGINPFEMTPVEATKFLHYERLRDKAIESGHGDPYAGTNEHWDLIFGKKKAAEMRQKLADHYGVTVGGLKDFFGVPKLEDQPKSEAPTSVSPDSFLADVQADDELTDRAKEIILKIFKKNGTEAAKAALAKFKEVLGSQSSAPTSAPTPTPGRPQPPPPSKTPQPPAATQSPASVSHSEKKMAGQLPISSPPQRQQSQVVPLPVSHSEKKLVGQLTPPSLPPRQHPSLRGMLAPKSPQTPPTPSHSEKKISGSEISQPSVRQLPTRAVSSPPSVRQLPAKNIGDESPGLPLPPKRTDILPTAYSPKLTDFFEKDLPVPERSVNEPPIQDKGAEIQVGSSESPGFKPIPGLNPKAKSKRPASKRKPKKKVD